MRSDMVARKMWQLVSEAAHSAHAWWPHWNAVLTGRSNQTAPSFPDGGAAAAGAAALGAGGADGLEAGESSSADSRTASWSTLTRSTCGASDDRWRAADMSYCSMSRSCLVLDNVAGGTSSF